MLGKVFARFVEKSPISVMVRGTLERVLGADQLNAWFARTAQKQYTRTVLFSTVYDVLSQVVFRIKPSIRAAYRDQEDKVGASLISLYNKLNGVETHTSAELVRYSTAVLTPLIEQLDGARVSWLPGYRVKILDGNCIEASERRLKVLREVQAGALPGKSLVVYEPAAGLVSDVFPCEDGHAQERSLLGLVLETVQDNDLWIQDRNFCTCAFLCEIDRRGAAFITRQHEGLPFEPVNVLRSVGRIETGHVAEQRVQVRDAQGLSWSEGARHLWPQTLFGVIVCGALALIAPAVLWWSLPLTAGYLLAIPFAVVTADPAFGRALKRLGICGIPEDFKPPAEIVAARATTA